MHDYDASYQPSSHSNPYSHHRPSTSTPSTRAFPSPAFSAHHGSGAGSVAGISLPPPAHDAAATWPRQSHPHAYPQPLPASHFSPPLVPQQQDRIDHEASAALLMLNAVDRRGSTAGSAPASSAAAIARAAGARESGLKSMSVKDLLRA